MKKKLFLKIMVIMAGLMQIVLMPSCSSSSVNDKLPESWVWITAGKQTDKEWKEILNNMKKADIKGMLLRGSPDDYRKVIPLASRKGIQVHAWIITLNRAWDEEAKKHPEWFTVSGKGESCHDVHPYVDHYQWVCPSREDVYQYVENEVMSLLDIEGLKGVHLDYVRYSDVILPVGLWAKYNLVQDREYPEFDFCYCDSCRTGFMSESGIDIRTLEDPATSEKWREYRWNSVTRFVNRLAEKVHSEKPGKMLTAAVFPYPEISRTICRQDWDKWSLDAFFPMIYHSFYNEDIEWIGTSVASGVNDLGGRAPLFSGLFLPSLPPDSIQDAINVSLENGASGICYFSYPSLSEEHWKILFSNARQ